MNAKPAVSTVALTASEVAPGVSKPVAAMTLAGLDQLAPIKAAGLTVVTQELLRMAGSGAGALLNAELQRAVVFVVDSIFLAGVIAAGVSPIPSGGSPIDTVGDVKALLAADELGANSRPYFVFGSAAVKAMIAQRFNGLRLWPNLTWSGGELNGVPCIVSDALPAGTAVLLDAAQLLVNVGAVELRSTQQGDIVLDTNPSMASLGGSPYSPTASNVTSMFQTNSSALLAERFFTFRLVRQTGAASLSGVAY